ncbi:MAG: hypothetical protein Tp1138SUR256061_35 [Prokaryotic dsDNA virus sp.]|nr:MAG: hypothetical protein Tp1138SUR256061_35 [Prokaryotic dsDNA virus sp.]|tara:strand:+ start:17415 stop:19424 length:2010 start_codon:yes stop_codon:yes gene_type:complete
MAVTAREYELKLSVADAEKKVAELNEQLEIQEQVIKDLEKASFKYNKRLEDTVKIQDRGALKKRIKQIKAEIADEKKGLQDLTKQRKKANDQLKDSQKSARDYSGVVGLLDQQTGGLISRTQGFTGALGAATKGSKLLRIALLAVPLIAIATAIAGVAKAFTSSEEGQNKFRRFFTQIQAVIGNVSDILADFGNVVLNVFTGNFKEAGKALEEVRQGIANFGEETRKEIKIAGELADKRAEADKLERQLLIDRAEATRKFNELREKAADKENVSIEDRIEALKEAGRIEAEITDAEIKAAELRLEAKVAENALADSTKEDLDEEAALRAKLIELEASRLKKQKTLTAEITTNLREAKAERKAEEAAEKAEQKQKDAEELAAAKALAELKKQIRDATAISEQERRDLELVKIDEQFQKLITQAQEQNLVTDELEAARREAVKAKQDEFDAEDEARRKANADKIKAEKEKELAEEEKIEAQKRATREKTFDNAVLLAGAESKVGKALLVAKQILLARQLILDAKEQISNAKKAVTNATVNAAESGVELGKGAAKSASAAPPPFNIPFILSFAATAFGIVSAIKSAVGATKSAAASAGASAGGAINVEAPSVEAAAPTIESTPPDVTGVGGSGVSQIAEALGNQQPVQAFVVSNDVTTAQGLDRNIIDGASL